MSGQGEVGMAARSLDMAMVSVAWRNNRELLNHREPSLVRAGMEELGGYRQGFVLIDLV